MDDTAPKSTPGGAARGGPYLEGDQLKLKPEEARTPLAYGKVLLDELRIVSGDLEDRRARIFGELLDTCEGASQRAAEEASKIWGSLLWSECLLVEGVVSPIPLADGDPSVCVYKLPVRGVCRETLQIFLGESVVYLEADLYSSPSPPIGELADLLGGRLQTPQSFTREFHEALFEALQPEGLGVAVKVWYPAFSWSPASSQLIPIYIGPNPTAWEQVLAGFERR